MRGQHQKFVYATAFSPDGASLVSVGQDRKIWLFDGKTGEVQKQIGEGEHTGSIFGVSWSVDSKQFVTCSADQTVKIWDAESGKATHTWRMGGDGVSIPDQQVGVVWPQGRNDGLVISIDLAGNLNYLKPGSEKPSRVVCGHQKNITAVGVTSKPQTIWTGSSEGRVRAWNVASGSASALDGEEHGNYVSHFTSSPDHARIYSAGWDDSVRTIDAATNSFTGSGTAKLPGQPRGLTTSSKGLVFAATTGAITAYSDGQQTLTHKLSKNFSPTALAASPTHNILVLSGEDKSLHIFSISDTTLEDTKSLAGLLTSALSAMAFSPDGAHLAVGTSSGGAITVLNSSTWEVVTTRWSAHTARVTSIAWSPDGKHAVSGSLDTNVFVWTLDKPGRRIKAGGAHKDGVNGVVWLDHDLVGSTGADASVKSWRVEGLQ